MVAPPLLTIVIFLWVGSTINDYVIKSLTNVTRDVIAWGIEEVIDVLPDDAQTLPDDPNSACIGDRVYFRLENKTYIPADVYGYVRKHHGSGPEPQTGWTIYQEYVQLKYLPPYVVVPLFAAVFVLVLYLLGKFIAAGIGRFAVHQFERIINRLPLIRNVYSSVKQVSDFFFAEREVEYTKVVAVEYPRKGIWSLGMVTGESMLDIQSAANEPVLSLLIPTSPMPVTGYTITVLKSETIDLNISIDQAFQFIVSCGVVVPPSQIVGLSEEERAEIRAAENRLPASEEQFLPGLGVMKRLDPAPASDQDVPPEESEVESEHAETGEPDSGELDSGHPGDDPERRGADSADEIGTSD